MVGQTLRHRRVDWGPLFILGWIGAVILGTILLLIYGPIPSDSKGVALLLLVFGPAASVAYVAGGLALATAGRWLGTTAVGRRLRADPRPVSPPRILAGVVVACLLTAAVALGTMLLRGSAVGVKVVEWLGPHFQSL